MRYLVLRSINVVELLREIGDLKQLQALDVLYTYLKELPATVSKLMCESRNEIAGGGWEYEVTAGATTGLGTHRCVQNPRHGCRQFKLTELRMLEISVDMEIDEGIGKTLPKSLCDLHKIQSQVINSSSASKMTRRT